MTKTKWINGVAKRCTERGCTAAPGCAHLYWIRKQKHSQHAFGTVAEFCHLRPAPWTGKIPRTRREAEDLAREVENVLASGQLYRLTAPVVTEPPIAAALADGSPPAPGAGLTINDLIDRFLKWKQLQIRLKKKSTAEADAYKVAAARRYFGARAISELTVETLQAYVLESLDQGKQLGTPNSILAAVIRPATLWGLAQKPPLVPANPFGRYGFHIDRESEGKRDRRCAPAEEAELFDAAAILNAPEYNYVGQTIADFLVLAIDLGPRSEEIFQMRNRDVDWSAHLITLRRTKHAKETRIVPFNPIGRVAALLERRRFAGPDAPVLAKYRKWMQGQPPVSLADPLTTIHKGWVHTVCLAHGVRYELRGKGKYLTPATAAAYKKINLRPHDLRHEFATWAGLHKCSDETAEFMQGHRRQTMHGRYKHEALRRAMDELAATIWLHESERAVAERRGRGAGTR
jgi:integrase